MKEKTMDNVLGTIVVTTLLLCAVGMLWCTQKAIQSINNHQMEYSEVLHVDAVIADAIYTPPNRELQPGIAAMKFGTIGIGPDGGPGVRVGGNFKVSEKTIPEKFEIVFEGDSWRLIVSSQEVYEKLKDHAGEQVDFAYRKAYWVTYETKDGKRQAVKREFQNYDFVDATLKE